MGKKGKKKAKSEVLNAAAAAARSEAVSSGTWMPRPAVHESKKDYSRQKSKEQTRQELDAHRDDV